MNDFYGSAVGFEMIIGLKICLVLMNLIDSSPKI
jgi:hypothetical protein